MIGPDIYGIGPPFWIISLGGYQKANVYATIPQNIVREIAALRRLYNCFVLFRPSASCDKCFTLSCDISPCMPHQVLWLKNQAKKLSQNRGIGHRVVLPLEMPTFDFIECLTTTFLRTHPWLNWVDEDDDEVGLKD